MKPKSIFISFLTILMLISIMFSTASAESKPILEISSDSYVEFSDVILVDDENALTNGPSTPPGRFGRFELMADVFPYGTLAGYLKVSDEQFTKNDLVGTMLQLYGNFTSTGGTNVKAGICYYNYAQGVYVAHMYDYYPLTGTNTYHYYYWSNLYSGVDYRAFTKLMGTSGAFRQSSFYVWDYGERR